MTFRFGAVTQSTQRMEISSAAVVERPYSDRVVPGFGYDRRNAVCDGIQWKRVTDVVVAIIALVLLSPVLLLAGIAVKLSSKGPVFFCQERIGVNRRTEDRRCRASYRGPVRRGKDRRVVVGYGKPFSIFKFRTMVADAEKGKPIWAQKNDARITRVGAFMRRTRIDELPQFVNVLQGSMSVVGPRPERAYFIAQIEQELPEFQERLRTKPGITGLAQVEQGYANSVDLMQEKLGFDIDYIKNLTPWMDFRILFKTVSVVVTGKGAC